MSAADSVPLEAFQGKADRAPAGAAANLKVLLSLFLLFILVVSDIFTNTVISGFGEKAVRGRSPTSWGVVLQGIFLVLFYAVAVYLIDHGVV